MANPFQRYQSGSFEPIQGLAESGANIGKMLGGGISSFGDSMSKGIMAFNENRAKFDAALADGEIAGSQLLQNQAAFVEASGVDPKLASAYLTWDGQPDDELDTDALKSVADNPFLRYAKMLQPARDALEKLPTMALPKALASLNAAKGSMAMVDQQMKLDQMISQARIENIVPELPTSTQRERDVKTGEIAVDPNNPFFKGIKAVHDKLVVQFPDAPEKVSAALDEYINNTGKEIDRSEATAAQKVEFNNAIAAYREGLRTQTGELTDYGQEDEFVQKSLAESYAAGQKALQAEAANAGKKKVNMPKVIMPEPDELKSLKQQRKNAEEKVSYYDNNVLKRKGLSESDREMHQRHRDEYAAEITGIDEKIKGVAIPEPETPLTEDEANIKLTEQATAARRAPLELNKKLNELGSQILSTVTNDYRSKIANGQKVTVMDIAKAITMSDIEQNPTTQTRVFAGGYGGAETRVPSKYTPARDILEQAAQKLGIKANTPITAEQMLALQKFMRKGVETQTAAAVEAGKKAEGITPEAVATDIANKADAVAAPAGPTEKGKPFNIGRLSLGTELYDDPLNSVQKEAAAREFYKAKFGAVPVGFTDMYRRMYPEATVRTTEIDVDGQKVPVMVDAKGNITQLKSGQTMSNVELAKEKAVTFNNTEIADGVRLSGVFSGTVSGAQSFRKDYAHMANVRTAINRLVEINESGYETLSPTMRQEADQLQSEIIAALRVPIIGPGQVAVPEQEILQRIVKNPTGLFNLEASDRAALKGLKDRVDRELTNWPKSMGLEVNISGNRSQTIKQLRLKRAEQERMIGEVQ
jgi:hypothetical protein